MQVIDTVLVFMSIYLMLLCIETFANLQSLDKTNKDVLNPNKNKIGKGKSLLSTTVFNNVFVLLDVELHTDDDK